MLNCHTCVMFITYIVINTSALPQTQNMSFIYVILDVIYLICAVISPVWPVMEGRLIS